MSFSTRPERRLCRGRLVAAALALSAPFMVSSATAQKSSCSAPVEDCLRYFAELAEKRGWVGVELTPNETTGGYTVTRVVEESPAESAGLAIGDVLKEINGVSYGDEASREELRAEVEKMTPGATIVYTVSRNGERMKIPVELGRLPASVIYRWTGRHMLEQHVERAAN